MIVDSIDPSNEVPEADLLEQRTPHDLTSNSDTETASDLPQALPDTVDEADALDQHAAIPDADEDDYPHLSTEQEWP